MDCDIILIIIHIIADIIFHIIHLDSCQTPISAYMRRYRYILILTPILALISMIPDIGVHRYRRLPISASYQNIPISAFADIGVCRYRRLPISGIPDIGYTRYRIYTDIGTIPQYTDIGVHTPISFHLCIRYRVTYSDVVNIVPDIGHDVSRFCLPGARRCWLSGCWRLFETAREGMLKCNHRYSFPI